MLQRFPERHLAAAALQTFSDRILRSQILGLRLRAFPLARTGFLSFVLEFAQIDPNRLTAHAFATLGPCHPHGPRSVEPPPLVSRRSLVLSFW